MRPDFGSFPVAVRPKSGPEGRFTARKHYCVTSSKFIRLGDAQGTLSPGGDVLLVVQVWAACVSLVAGSSLTNPRISKHHFLHTATAGHDFSSSTNLVHRYREHVFMIIQTRVLCCSAMFFSLIGRSSVFVDPEIVRDGWGLIPGPGRGVWGSGPPNPVYL